MDDLTAPGRPQPPARRLYSVSELTRQIQELLESRFPFVWVHGEISNFRAAASRHFYFTLKDEAAQIAGVMFAGQNRRLKFRPGDGMRVTGLGRLALYAPRGAYQIVFEYIEPEGVGALQMAFEQLKERLSAEGLFDPARKRPIPMLPRRVAVITSPTGAVVHDILNVIGRRFPNVHVRILPVRVQGEGADREIAAAIERINRAGAARGGGADVLILARGGGSLEDLAAFNSEIVARAIAASRIPVVCGVGHETDYTIADFTADLRAPTPSAAAELVVPSRLELERRARKAAADLMSAFNAGLARRRERLEATARRLAHPGRRLTDLRLRADELFLRLENGMRSMIRSGRERFEWRRLRLFSKRLERDLAGRRERLGRLDRDLAAAMARRLKAAADRRSILEDRLSAASPGAALARGYSIARMPPGGAVLRSARAARVGGQVSVTLARGELICRVERIVDEPSGDNGESKELCRNRK